MSFSPSAPPRHSEIGILALVPDLWVQEVWMPRHQVLTRLATHFHVVWMDPPHHWRDVGRRLTGRSARENVAGNAPSMEVYSPDWWLPQVHRPKRLSRLMFRARLMRARRRLLQRGCKRIILYIWRPQFAEALELVTHDLSCYHMDDEYSFSSVDQPVETSEQLLLERVDQVFLHSPALFDKKGAINPRSLQVPNGVDYQAYARPWPEPPDLADVPRPRVGYCGVLKPQLDWSLIEELTRRHREWSFVFVGRLSRGSHPQLVRIHDSMTRQPNVFFLGSKPVDQLPAYTQHFDVCLMPYRVDGYTKYIYPLKLHEYLAAGRPVVGAPIRSLQDFADLVSLPRSPEEWSQAVADALRPEADTAERREARRSMARQYDWNILVGRIASTLARRLAEKLPAAVEVTP